MIKKDINQNDILNSELLNAIDYNYKYSDKPIKRLKTKPILENSLSELEILKKKINNIEDCELKKNSSKIVFNDGNHLSSIMIIGDYPNQKDDEMGKPLTGEVGALFDKMLNAINLTRKKIYITNVINYLPLINRKPTLSELNRYTEFLKEHIITINPTIIILMGSTAMDAILGSNKTISNERGKWKEVIIRGKNFKTIITFHPAYLLRKPDKKKFSWEDLKLIRNEILKQKINF
tara:strand:+ start:200 stop:904 length:705 start_codon:yes stop_codon:yes gene_type:complete